MASDKFEPSRAKQIIELLKTAFIVTVILISAVACIIVLMNYAPAYHEYTDQAQVVQDNTYLADSGYGGSASVNGNIVIHDFRNGLNYTFTPRCNYWKLGSTLTIRISWGWGIADSEQNPALTIVSNVPSGCSGATP